MQPVSVLDNVRSAFPAGYGSDTFYSLHEFPAEVHISHGIPCTTLHDRDFSGVYRMATGKWLRTIGALLKSAAYPSSEIAGKTRSMPSRRRPKPRRAVLYVSQILKVGRCVQGATRPLTTEHRRRSPGWPWPDVVCRGSKAHQGPPRAVERRFTGEAAARLPEEATSLPHSLGCPEGDPGFVRY
jgi:hypothetical protein